MGKLNNEEISVRLARLKEERDRLYFFFLAIEDDYKAMKHGIKKEHVQSAKLNYLNKETEYQLFRKEIGLDYYIPDKEER